jgi:hypothetical protein
MEDAIVIESGPRLSELILPALGLLIAAFCIWLAVRVVNRRERWAKRTALGLTIVLVFYPLSLGPACWITSRLQRGEGIVTAAFRPIMWTVSDDSTNSFRRLVFWYSALGSDDPRWGWFRYSDPMSPSGKTDWQWGQLPRY